MDRPLPLVLDDCAAADGDWGVADMLGAVEARGVGRGVKLGRGDGATEGARDGAAVGVGSRSSFSLAARRSSASAKERGCGMVSENRTDDKSKIQRRRGEKGRAS